MGTIGTVRQYSAVRLPFDSYPIRVRVRVRVRVGVRPFDNYPLRIDI